MEDAVNIQNVNSAWNVITQVLRPCSKEADASAPSREEFNSAVSVLHHNGMSHIIRDWFLASFQDELHNVIIPEFWLQFKASQSFWRFPNALSHLYNRLQSYKPAINELQSLQDNLLAQIHTLPADGQTNLYNNKTPLMTEVFSVARCLMFATWPVDFRAVLVKFFLQSFKCYHKFKKSKYIKEEEPALKCLFCDENIDRCCCEQYLNAFYIAMKNLYELQFFQTVVGDVPINVAQDVLETHIQESCKGNFEVPLLNSLKLWLETTVMSWLSTFYWETYGDVPASKLLSEYKKRLLNILYDGFTAIRLDQLFDIIIEFPESQDALEDLTECLEMTHVRSKLISSLRSSLETRLLHPGVNTSDILTAYISAIKALRVLDRSGVVLQVVSEPVCKYLRSREDTVRCIISSLREDSCGELACELMKGVPLKLEDTYPSDEEVDDWEKWCPDPVDVDPAKASESQRSSDIIGILVNIYGSKELFVNEYRSLLADRILTTFSYNTEREIRYLELLKLRFGESQLHFCEVMLKDIADSKRLNTHLNSGEFKSYEQGVLPMDEVPKPIKVSFQTKDKFTKNPERLLVRLERLNPELKTDGWRVLSHTAGEESACWIFEVDVDSVNTIKKYGYSVYAGIDKGVFKILNDPNQKTGSGREEAKGTATPAEDTMMEAIPEANPATEESDPSNLKEPDSGLSTAKAPSNDFPVNTMILSAQFWPSFKEEKLRLPEYIWSHLKKYTTAFEALKGNRTLVWKPHLGNVDLEIELKGRTLNLSVSPVHATILWHFQDKPRWTISDLSTVIHLQASVLRRKITFWQNHGVLHEEENDVFVLMEDQNPTNRDSVVMIEEEEESVTASSQDMKEEELQTFWSFIVGMLTNMESLPLERIHSMLRMFAVQGTSTNECSIQDMKQFLERKVRDRQLVYSSGMFKLPKFDS